MKNHMKIFWFMTFYTNICSVQNDCVLDLTEWMNLLEFKVGLDT